MIRKHIPKHSLIVISLLLALFISGHVSAVEFNSTNWDLTPGTMLEHGDGNLRAPPNITDGLVSYWSFEAGYGSTLYDVWGNTDGTIYPGASFSSNGAVEDGMYFDGSGYVNFGYAESLNLSSEFILESRSGDTNSHQGVAYDGTYYYCIDTTILWKYDSSYNLVTYNDSILDATPSPIDNHIGDGVELNGLLYLPTEYWINSTNNSDKYITVVDATDLTYVTAYNISSVLPVNSDAAGIASDGTYLYVVSFSDGNSIWKFDLVGNHEGTISLSSPVSNAQGITYDPDNNIFYISAGGDNYIFVYNIDGSKGPRIFESTSSFLEGLDYYDVDNNLLVIEDFGALETVTVLNKPSSFTNGYTFIVSLNSTSAVAEQAIMSRYDYNDDLRQYYHTIKSNNYRNQIGIRDGTDSNVAAISFLLNEYHTYSSIWNATDDNVYAERDSTISAATSFDSIYQGFYQQTALGRLIDTPVTAYYTGYMDELYIYNRTLTSEQRSEVRNNTHTLDSYIELDLPIDAGAGYVYNYYNVSGINTSANTSIHLQVRGNDTSAWETVDADVSMNTNNIIPFGSRHQNLLFRLYANTTYQPETNIIESIDFLTLFQTPNLTSPSNSSTIYSTFPPLLYDVTFLWQDVASPQYKLVVAEDINFNILVVTTHTGTNNNVQSLLVNKEYFWKVYSYDGMVYSNSSDVYSFNLTGNSSLSGSAIEGVVYTEIDGVYTAVSGSEVSIWNSTWSTTQLVGSNGYYVFEDLDSGTVYNLQAKSDRYLDSSIALVSAEADPVTNNFYLIDDLTDTEWWHYVEFKIQNIWDVKYPGVATKVYIGDSPTIYESGNTESDGTISFHLDQNIRYRITFINSTLGINEEIALYPISKSYTVYIDSYSFDLPDAVTDDIQAYITSSRINATYGYINFTYSDTSDLTTSINYYIHDVDGNLLYDTSTSNSDIFDSQIVAATDDRYIVRYVGVHPTHDIIDKTETIVFHGGRRVDFGWPHDWQYAVTALAFLIFIGSMFGAKTAHYGAIAVVMFAWIFKWIGWLDETNTSTLLIVLAAVIAFGWSLRKSEEVKM